VFSPFFFAENTVTGTTCLDMLSEWLLPQLQEHYDDFILQQDRAPPHLHREVRRFGGSSMDICHSTRIGHSVRNIDLPLEEWPPRFPEITPCDFFFWGYVKDHVIVPPLPRNRQELKERTVAAVSAINIVIIHKVWDKLDYRPCDKRGHILNICRIKNKL
jgi:hypothetical protein